MTSLDGQSIVNHGVPILICTKNLEMAGQCRQRTKQAADVDGDFLSCGTFSGEWIYPDYCSCFGH